jgi:hypothetical protein
MEVIEERWVGFLSGWVGRERDGAWLMRYIIFNEMVVGSEIIIIKKMNT